MIAELILGLALASASDVAAPQALSPEAACALSRSDHIPPETSYSIRGTYFSDGIHGSRLEIPACDLTMSPVMDGEVAVKIMDYHYAFTRQCGGQLWGDDISGVFTGKFVRRKARLFGMQSPAMLEFFVISGIETKDLNASAITCPKQPRRAENSP